MGTYTPFPTDLTAYDILTASFLNTYLVDNIEAIKAPANASATTTTLQDVTSTSFTDLTAMTCTVTPSHASGTGILHVVGMITVRPSASASQFATIIDLLVGGTSVSGGAGIAQVYGNVNQYYTVTIDRIVTGVTTGAKICKLQAKVDSTATARYHIGTAQNYLAVIER